MTKLEKYGNKVAEAAAHEGRPEGVGSGSDSQLLPSFLKEEKMARSARINFGTPDGELIVTADDAGIVQSVYDPETNTEYVGDLSIAEVKFVRGTATGSISLKLCVIDSWTLGGITFYYSCPEMYLNEGETEKTLNVIMCKGLAGISSDRPVAFSGDAYDGLLGCITGAGTITINEL